MPALAAIFGRHAYTRQKLTNFPIGQPIMNHLFNRFDDSLFPQVRHRQPIRHSVAVRHLRGVTARFSLASKLEFEPQKSHPNSLFRGKSFSRNLGYRTAFSDVFLGEEILALPEGGVVKINGVNDMRDR